VGLIAHNIQAYTYYGDDTQSRNRRRFSEADFLRQSLDCVSSPLARIMLATDCFSYVCCLLFFKALYTTPGTLFTLKNCENTNLKTLTEEITGTTNIEMYTNLTYFQSYSMYH